MEQGDSILPVIAADAAEFGKNQGLPIFRTIQVALLDVFEVFHTEVLVQRAYYAPCLLRFD